jgi:hypothetical protein
VRIAFRAAVLAVSIVACRDGAPAGERPLADEPYMNAMADLLRLDQARRSRPSPAWPGPVAGRLSTDTSWKVERRAESLQVVRADSAARAEVLARHGVTEAQLEATAVALAGAPKRARIVWDSIATRAARQRTNPDSAGAAGRTIPDSTMPAGTPPAGGASAAPRTPVSARR